MHMIHIYVHAHDIYASPQLCILFVTPFFAHTMPYHWGTKSNIPLCEMMTLIHCHLRWDLHHFVSDSSFELGHDLGWKTPWITVETGCHNKVCWNCDVSQSDNFIFCHDAPSDGKGAWRGRRGWQVPSPERNWVQLQVREEHLREDYRVQMEAILCDPTDQPSCFLETFSLHSWKMVTGKH